MGSPDRHPALTERQMARAAVLTYSAMLLVRHYRYDLRQSMASRTCKRALRHQLKECWEALKDRSEPVWAGRTAVRRSQKGKWRAAAAPPTVRLRAGWRRRARVRTSRNSAIGLEFHSTHRAMRPMMRRAWPCRTRRSRSFRLQARFRGSPRAVPRNGWYKLVLFGPQCKHMPRNTTDGGYFTADLQPCNHIYHWKKVRVIPSAVDVNLGKFR